MKALSRWLLALMIGLLLAADATAARAQAEIDEPVTTSATPIKLIIDTDAGVDDSLAIAYLLSQRDQPVNLLGITAVAGNTAVENAANNALILLETAGRSGVPVVVGASQPLSRTLSRTGKLIHGPDGLWFVGAAHPHDTAALPHDAPAFYRKHARLNPGAVLVALGPLTNVAAAIRRYPQEMRAYSKIVVLGGAQRGGNQTPVSEFNIWQDPEAADIVLRSGIPLAMVPLDAFNTFTVTAEDIDDLRGDGNALARLLAEPLAAYAQVQTGLGGQAAASIPDVPAVMFALHPELGSPLPALVEVIPAPRLVRGQTIMGLAFGDKLTMLAQDDELSQIADAYFADPTFDLNAALGAILARRPDNAQVVLDINERRMRRLFLRALTR